jgi:hypothetical protein
VNAEAQTGSASHARARVAPVSGRGVIGVDIALTSSAVPLRQRAGGRAPVSDVGGLALAVPVEWLDALAAAVADRLSVDAVSPWMTRAAAAVYLGVPVSRLEKDRTVPSHLWDGRRLYHRVELDEWLLAMGAK